MKHYFQPVAVLLLGCSSQHATQSHISAVACVDDNIVAGPSGWEDEGVYQFEMDDTMRLIEPSAGNPGLVDTRFALGFGVLRASYTAEGMANVYYLGEGVGEISESYNVVGAENCEGEFPSKLTIDEDERQITIRVEMYDLHEAGECPGGRLDGAISVCVRLTKDRYTIRRE